MSTFPEEYMSFPMGARGTTNAIQAFFRTCGFHGDHRSLRVEVDLFAVVIYCDLYAVLTKPQP